MIRDGEIAARRNLAAMVSELAARMIALSSCLSTLCTEGHLPRRELDLGGSLTPTVGMAGGRAASDRQPGYRETLRSVLNCDQDVLRVQMRDIDASTRRIDVIYASFTRHR